MTTGKATAAGRLRQLLAMDKPVLVAGAHDGLSARLVERAGFAAIWASGFEISAVHAVPDANILTMSDNLVSIRMMISASDLPIIADCDSGYGNAVNVIRTVEEYERAGVAGIVLEDNVFPKRCSFYDGVQRLLTPIEEHAGKIRAAKAAQRSPDFFVAARTEALILGLGLEEALRRAEAYHAAGADAVMIHSKAKTPDEVLAAGRAWRGKCPLIAVPTTYSRVSAAALYQAGYKMIIFANIAVRAAAKAMAAALAKARQAEQLAAVESDIATLAEIYDLVGVASLADQERKFVV
ncbi:MAG TPA: phosphoenolpyruvate phosphomutase [Firmicutes bacterium]|nr:phosphoenolpyruvate phosphomutase [Bacillota bacterium]